MEVLLIVAVLLIYMTQGYLDITLWDRSEISSCIYQHCCSCL